MKYKVVFFIVIWVFVLTLTTSALAFTMPEVLALNGLDFSAGFGWGSVESMGLFFFGMLTLSVEGIPEWLQFFATWIPVILLILIIISIIRGTD